MAVQNKAIDPALIVKPINAVGKSNKPATTPAGTLKTEIKSVKPIDSSPASNSMSDSANNNSAATSFADQHQQYISASEAKLDANKAANDLAYNAAMANANAALSSVAETRLSGASSEAHSFAKSAEQMGTVAALPTQKTELQSANSPLTAIAAEAGNAVAQAGRIPGGIAQGALKIAAAPGLALEAVNQINANTYTEAQSVFSDLRQDTPYLTQAELIDARDTGAITAEQYNATLDSWRVNGSPLDNPDVYKQIWNNNQNVEINTPITDFTRNANQTIENITNSIVPAPTNPVSEFTAKGFDALGEAIPNMALSIATGGTMLGGNALSYAAAGLSGFSNEMIEGSGDFNRALTTGAIEAGTELIGGQTFNKAADLIDGKLLSKAVDSLGEGAEEVLSGITNAVITGDNYSLSDALYDAALGTFVGGVTQGSTTAVNAVKNEIGTIKTISDIKSGKSGGAIGGLTESLKIAEANPDTYGDIARILATPAEQSAFDTGSLRTYVESAMGESGRNDIKIPANIDNVKAENLGQYNTLSESGLRNAASVLEAAQVGKGLSPSQSGRILNTVLETNTKLYNKLSDIGGNPVDTSNTVRIDKGVDYSRQSPTSGTADNYTIIDTQGRTAETSAGDTGLNVFRGMTSEWVIPTLNKGEFVVPNPTSSSGTETGTESLFGTKPGAMLGQGLYLTSIPSKADQYTSGVENEISMTGRDSGGIMKHSPLIAGKTYVNESALNQAESGIVNDTVRRGTVGDETLLADFINTSAGNSEAAAIYSKVGNDYTEIVRPDTTKTQIESLYVPLSAVNSDVSQSNIDNNVAADNTNTNLPAAELGVQQAINSTTDTESRMGNDDVNSLLNNNIGADLEIGNVAARSDSERDSSVTATEESTIANNIQTGEITLPKPINESATATEMKSTDTKTLSDSIIKPIMQSAESEAPKITVPFSELNQASSQSESGSQSSIPQSEPTNPAVNRDIIRNDQTPNSNISANQPSTNPVSSREPDSMIRESSMPEPNSGESNVKENSGTPENERPIGEKSAAEIWTPVKFMQESLENEMRQKHKRGNDSGDFGINIGPGATGQVYETTGYNSTFGGLASY